MLRAVKSAAAVSSLSVFWRFPFLTGYGAGIFLHQRQRNE